MSIKIKDRWLFFACTGCYYESMTPQDPEPCMHPSCAEELRQLNLRENGGVIHHVSKTVAKKHRHWRSFIDDLRIHRYTLSQEELDEWEGGKQMARAVRARA